MTRRRNALPKKEIAPADVFGFRELTIFAIAHPRETAIFEIVSGVRQHSHIRLSAGCMVIRFSQFLTNLESLVAADRFGGKGTSANARNRPGPQRDPTSSGT